MGSSLFSFRFFPGSALRFFKVPVNACDYCIIHQTEIVGDKKRFYFKVFLFKKITYQA